MTIAIGQDQERGLFDLISVELEFHIFRSKTIWLKDIR